jgi:pimeloyl-ACP methyl ester carboxylesterase
MSQCGIPRCAFPGQKQADVATIPREVDPVDGRLVRIEQHRTQVGPARIAYQVAGAGPPLVLVHGLSGSARWWHRNTPALARHFRVYVVDLLGFGGSRGRQAFVLGEAAEHLARWMQHVGVERASVAGHSMGGFVAADLAAGFPELVDRLVLVDAAALPLGRGYVQHAVGLAGALRYCPPSFLPVLVGDALRAGMWTLVGAALQLLRSDITVRLSEIRAPTLVVWGEHDPLVPLEIGRRLQEALPDARLEIIAGAGHNPMWDRPAAFNRLVLEFLGAPADP